jgi:hypothetical protein
MSSPGRQRVPAMLYGGETERRLSRGPKQGDLGLHPEGFAAALVSGDDG